MRIFFDEFIEVMIMLDRQSCIVRYIGIYLLNLLLYLLKVQTVHSCILFRNILSCTYW